MQERGAESAMWRLQVSSKIDVIKTLLEKADKVIIVGGMVFTFDKALGRKVRHCAALTPEMTFWLPVSQLMHS
jgi:Phosphoglycerate kinase